MVYKYRVTVHSNYHRCSTSVPATIYSSCARTYTIVSAPLVITWRFIQYLWH